MVTSQCILEEIGGAKQETLGRQAPRVLVTDDELYIRELLRYWLTKAGYECETARDAQEALGCLESTPFDLLISDMRMPGRSGMELIETVRMRYPLLAIVVVTAIDERETAMAALRMGAYGYVIKPFHENEIVINVANALQRRALVLESQRYQKYLEEQVRARTVDLRLREEAIVVHLMSAAELRDDETGAHVRRIGKYVAILAEALHKEIDLLDDLRLAAPMHDIGKIGIPDRILRKPGPLNSHEAKIMQTHTVLGARILEDASVPLLKLAAEIARTHHERWDGLGYPAGLVGEAIPLGGRLVAIADTYDALVHDRVYRPALSENKALSLIRQERGRQFDPEICDCLIDCLPHLRAIREEIPEGRMSSRGD